MRAVRSLPIGMRITEPRSLAETLIWFGASKCGSRRRYELTLELRIRQMSLAFARIRFRTPQAKLDRPSRPLLSWKAFLPFFAIDMLVWQPLPLTFCTGLGRKDA